MEFKPHEIYCFNAINLFDIINDVKLLLKRVLIDLTKISPGQLYYVCDCCDKITKCARHFRMGEHDYWDDEYPTDYGTTCVGKFYVTDSSLWDMSYDCSHCSYTTSYTVNVTESRVRLRYFVECFCGKYTTSFPCDSCNKKLIMDEDGVITLVPP